MRARIVLLCLVLSPAFAGAGAALSRAPGDHVEVDSRMLLAQALAGEDGKEVVAQTYEFAPGVELPWHIHPEVHEIVYVLEGTLTFQRAGERPREIGTGEADYLAPNVVHRGMNKGDTPVKLYVVRIKPKDRPLVEDVPPPR